MKDSTNKIRNEGGAKKRNTIEPTERNSQKQKAKKQLHKWIQCNIPDSQTETWKTTAKKVTKIQCYSSSTTFNTEGQVGIKPGIINSYIEGENKMKKIYASYKP